MSKYTVTWTHEVECDAPERAVYEAFLSLVKLAGNPYWGDAALHVSSPDEGYRADMDIMNSLLEVDPILVSQLLGFRHMVWVSQGRGRP